ncbi:neurotransmitter-gated ion-channel ligand binding domain-containing protein [Ditylenchus destructor]|uniref:Neurotransmitter-gated ion-channel ligand binding domain-containing protein n=1 Tax=Ditylenchus destructor TaxID=166010 RepID=A0AAD4NDL3_9BILA|nr:neurotransmitter-gated ion-channel ligand binding domain-containing protein [Ditylenchus destructor]
MCFAFVFADSRTASAQNTNVLIDNSEKVSKIETNEEYTKHKFNMPLGAGPSLLESEDTDEEDVELEDDDDSDHSLSNSGVKKSGNTTHLSRQNRKRRRRKLRRRALTAKSEYLLPENFASLRRKDIPVTYRLHDDLLRYYRKGTRPVTHPNKIISVSMSVFLYQIIKLDAVKNTISLSGSFELYWQDEFLQWSPDAYEGSTEIFLSSGDIWIPEFSLYYSLNFNDAVKLISNNDVRVNYTGHIRYYLPFSTESLCNSVDVKFFPFDIQQCTLLFGSWAHSNDSIKYSLYSKNLSLIDFYDNQEWQLDLSRSHIMSDGFLYDYLDPPLFWEMIVIDLVVVRQSFYYVFNLVIPSAIITLVAVIGFHTPSTSGRMRDAKFRLGIMTLMSMSMILLAIVEDMPKFSISSNRRGRGSFSGIPLIGLYYFMLLAIVGLSTVTSSMFVFVERDVRLNRRIPWYLRAMLYLDDVLSKPTVRGIGLAKSSFRRRNYTCSSNAAFNPFTRPSNEDLAASEALLTSSATSAAPPGHSCESPIQTLAPLAGDHANSAASMHASSADLRAPSQLGSRAASYSNQHYQDTYFNPATGPMESPPPPQSSAAANRRNLKRRRLSLVHYDNMLIYECFHQLVEELVGCAERIERTIHSIRHDLSSSQRNDYSQHPLARSPSLETEDETKWQRAIRRMELISLAFYVTLLFTTMFLFFYHDWYCSIGHNPCGQPNLKCPWMKSNPSDPSCRI